jgi:hypothetical protein
MVVTSCIVLSGQASALNFSVADSPTTQDLTRSLMIDADPLYPLLTFMSMKGDSKNGFIGGTHILAPSNDWTREDISQSKLSRLQYRRLSFFWVWGWWGWQALTTEGNLSNSDHVLAGEDRSGLFIINKKPG